MAKKRIIYQENYKANTVATDEQKQEFLDLLNSPHIDIVVKSAGKYEDGRMFFDIRIDNV